MATLYPLFIFYRLIILAPYSSFNYLIWIHKEANSFHTSLFVVLLLVSIVLLWSRYLGTGLLILGSVMIVQKDINQAFVLTWMRILLLVMIFRYLSFYLKSVSWRKTSYYFYLAFVLSVYWVSILDRMTNTLWFDGWIVASFISTPYFSHFPFAIPVEYFSYLAPLSITGYFLEATGPFAYLFWGEKRKQIAYIMAAFHFCIMILGDVEMWQPLMILVWLDLSKPDFDISKIARTAILSFILFTSPYSSLPMLKPLHPLVFNKVTNFMARVGVLNFSVLHLFSSDMMPVYKNYEMNLYQGDKKIKVHSGLNVLFLRYFIGFYVPYPMVPITNLCKNKEDGPYKLEVKAQAVGWNVERIAYGDCKTNFNEAKESIDGNPWIIFAPPKRTIN